MSVVRSKGVSRVLTEVFMVVVVISMMAAFAAQQMGLLGNLGQSPALDLSASQAWVNPVDGSGQMLIKIRNTGTGTVRVKTITFAGAKVSTVKLYFSTTTPAFNATDGQTDIFKAYPGTLYADTAGAGITSDDYLFVPSGARVTLEFTFTTNLNRVFDAGSTYKLTIATSGEVFSAKLTFSG